MRILAFILMLACLWDIIQTIIVVETGRRDSGVKTFAAYQVIMNTLAINFFVVYLFGR